MGFRGEEGELSHHSLRWVGQLVILEMPRSQEASSPGQPGLLPPPLTGGYSVALVLDELLDEAPVTWFRSYRGTPPRPPIRLTELIMDLPHEMPAGGGDKAGQGRGAPQTRCTLQGSCHRVRPRLR